MTDIRGTRLCAGWDEGACVAQVRILTTGGALRCPDCKKQQRLIDSRKSYGRLKNVVRLRRKKTRAQWQERVFEVADQHPGRAELMELAREAGLIKFKQGKR